MSDSLLVLEAVTKHYTLRGAGARAVVRACQEVTLDIEPGEWVSLVGESGSGKSTLGRLAVLLERPDAGRVRFDGVDLTALPGRALRRRRPDFQVIFQDPRSSLNPRWTIGTSVAHPMHVRGGLSRSAIAARVRELLETVELPSSFARRYPHELSGGQQQRASIARALAPAPRLVLADEPVSGLDVSTQAHILQLLKQVQRDQGTAFLFISHDLRIVKHLSSRVAVMHHGDLVEFRPAAELFAAPEHEYTRQLIDNVIDAGLRAPQVEPDGNPVEPSIRRRA